MHYLTCSEFIFFTILLYGKPHNFCFMPMLVMLLKNI